MKAAITGASGQLGKELQRTFSEKSLSFVKVEKIQLDITNYEKTLNFIEHANPDWLINCAAYTKVDQAEREIDEVNQVNALGPKLLSQICRARGINLIHISTDSVFSSNVPKHFLVSDSPNPINAYARSKSLGEQYIREEYSDGAWIIRTSWIYGQFGGNFVQNILGRLDDDNEINVVNDQFGQPTYTRNLAGYIYQMIVEHPRPGIYHYADSGFTSRYFLAKQIVRELDGNAERVIAIETDKKSVLALRPKFSLLDLEESKFSSNVPSQSWNESLSYFLENWKRRTANE